MEQEKKQKPLLQEMAELKEKVENIGIKRKKMRIPRKAKVKKGKVKKGWIGIIRIDENGNLSGEKQRLEDSTIRLNGKTYHATDGSEVGFWQGKYPVIIQPTWRKNPLKIRQGEDANETYGQKYIMARMLGDTIKVKTAGAKGLLYVIGFGIAAYIGYMLITGQL